MTDRQKAMLRDSVAFHNAAKRLPDFAASADGNSLVCGELSVPVILGHNPTDTELHDAFLNALGRLTLLAMTKYKKAA